MLVGVESPFEVTHIALRGLDRLSLSLKQCPLKITVGGKTFPPAEMIGIIVTVSQTSPSMPSAEADLLSLCAKFYVYSYPKSNKSHPLKRCSLVQSHNL